MFRHNVGMPSILHRRCRVVALVLFTVAFASRVLAQPPNVTMTISASPTRPAPGSLVTFTLTVSNGGLADVQNLIVAPPSGDGSERVVATIVPPGTSLRLHPNPFAEGALSLNAIDIPIFRRGASLTISTVFEVLSPPGGPITVFGRAWAGTTFSAFASVTGTATVAGSGNPPTNASQLFTPGLVVSQLPVFSQTGLFWDPVRGGYIAVGTNTQGVVTSLLTSAGADASNVLMAYPWPFPVDQVDVPAVSPAYSRDFGDAQNGGGLLLIWRNPLSSPELTGGIVLSTLTMRPVGTFAPFITPGIVYSPVKRQFLTFWQFTDRIRGQWLGLDALPMGPVFDIAAGINTSTGFRLALNTVTNEFGMTFTEMRPEERILYFARLDTNAAMITRVELARFPPFTGEAGVLGVNGRSGQYIVLWNAVAAGVSSDVLLGAELRANGALVTRGRVADAFRLFGTPFIYNSVTGTFFVTAQQNAEEQSVLELNQHGSPMSAPKRVAAGPFFTTTLVAARPDAPEWLLVGRIGGFPSAEPFRMAALVAVSQSPFGGSSMRLGGCVSLDPFEFLGGGACYDGGWLPPGMPAPGMSPPVAPGGCALPDPFATLGGGRCVDGGWQPPPPVVNPSPGSCSSQKPAADWVCVGQGWVPPNHPLAQPSPLPPPPPTCVGSDPFVSIGGGTCINGGWVPRR
jgi:hypothetical protein